MEVKKNTFGEIIKIDNSRKWLPILTSLMVVVLVILLVWFLRGGSFRLYSSVFFGLYALTGRIWISVILIGFAQNIVFLPLRLIRKKFSDSLSEFEDELEKQKEDQQYFIFQKKVKEGDVSVILYILDFVINAIAFVSAGRIFLIDFYSKPIGANFMYDWVPRPQYPLKGTIFNFPFFSVNSYSSMGWWEIFKYLFIFSVIIALPRLIWRLVKFLLKRDKKILQARKGYNRLMNLAGGIGVTLFLVAIILMRKTPTSFSFRWLRLDLTKQNSTMNLITAIGTFLTAFHAGTKRSLELAKKAKKAKIPDEIIKKVAKDYFHQTLQNSLILGAGAYFVTNQIPSAFELSVATFEAIYMISPYTFDKLVDRGSQKMTVEEVKIEDTKTNET